MVFRAQRGFDKGGGLDRVEHEADKPPEEKRDGFINGEKAPKNTKKNTYIELFILTFLMKVYIGMPRM